MQQQAGAGRMRVASVPALVAVNDFVVKFANVNGSGSASANELFAKAILRMGVPVSPRNIFPSNIQGLPTWYEVRVTERGHLGRRGGVDLMVAMNPQTWVADIAEIEPGGYLFYDNSKPLPPSRFRDDVHVIGVPLTELCNAAYSDPRQRQLFKNIVYVGALSALLDIDAGVIEKLLGEQYKSKPKLIDSNRTALHMVAITSSPICSIPLDCVFGQPTRSASAFSSTATVPRRWVAFMVAQRYARGTRSRRHPPAPRRSSPTARNTASTPLPAATCTPSSRPKTRSHRSAWWSVPAGMARARSPPPPDPACR